MKTVLKSIARRSLGLLWGARELNAFVYNACLRARVKWPDIPVPPVELYGQFGEDLIVLSILEARALNERLDLKNERYLEIGGNHPFATSATFLLNKRLGMTGVIVEANPRLISGLKRGRPNDVVVHAAVQDKDANTVTLSISKLSELSSLDRGWTDGQAGQMELVDVPAVRINQIIKEYLGDVAPCFLSIDVEGLDLALLEDLDFNRYRPWLIQAEAPERYLPESTKHIIEYMRSDNYYLIARTAINLIFRDSRH
jgi:FkbM family methyltransferase